MDVVSRLRFLTKILVELSKNHKEYVFNLNITAENFLFCTEEKELFEIWPSRLTLQKIEGGKLIGISNFNRENAPGLNCTERGAQYPPFAPVIYTMKSLDGLGKNTDAELENCIKARKNIFLHVQPRFSCLSEKDYLRLESDDYWKTRIGEWIDKKNWKNYSRAELFSLIDLYGIALCLDALYKDMKSSQAKLKVQEFCFDCLFMNRGKRRVPLMEEIRDYEKKNAGFTMTNVSFYGTIKPQRVIPYNIDPDRKKVEIDQIARFLVTGSVYYFLI